MEKYIKKAEILIEALSYIKKFRNKVIVIKYGGSAMIDEDIKMAVMQDIAFLKLAGIHPVVVHGGGPEINKSLKQAGKEPEFINGLRVTDRETMQIVETALDGINKEIMRNLNNFGVDTVGVCGKKGNVLLAQKKHTAGYDLGFVGKIISVNMDALAVQDDFIPIIAPVGTDNEGNSYNINADYAAVAVAGALKAEKLVFLTDVAGVLKDLSDSSSLISRLSVKDIPGYIEDKTISGGMIPKVECCIEGIKQGVKSVYILDGRIRHSLLLEIFTEKGFGTIIEE